MYRPPYEKSLQTRTETVNVETVHQRGVDWAYPFADELQRDPTECVGYLRFADDNAESGNAYVTTDGGWPRFGWRRVLRTAMVSKWPYWTCRPCVLVAGPLGPEWYDWAALTGAELRGVPTKASASPSA